VKIRKKKKKNIPPGGTKFEIQITSFMLCSKDYKLVSVVSIMHLTLIKTAALLVSWLQIFPPQYYFLG
jgi:hypothetical protein